MQELWARSCLLPINTNLHSNLYRFRFMCLIRPCLVQISSNYFWTFNMLSLMLNCRGFSSHMGKLCLYWSLNVQQIWEKYAKITQLEEGKRRIGRWCSESQTCSKFLMNTFFFLVYLYWARKKISLKLQISLQHDSSISAVTNKKHLKNEIYRTAEVLLWKCTFKLRFDLQGLRKQWTSSIKCWKGEFK